MGHRHPCQANLLHFGRENTQGFRLFQNSSHLLLTRCSSDFQCEHQIVSLPLVEEDLVFPGYPAHRPVHTSSLTSSSIQHHRLCPELTCSILYSLPSVQLVSWKLVHVDATHRTLFSQN